MFFNIWYCNELKKSHETLHGFTYDIVIRLRTELKFFSRPSTRLYQQIQQGSNETYIPIGYEWGGVTDLFAFGSSKSMDKYCSVWKKLSSQPKCNEEAPFLNNESLLLYHLKREGVQFEKTPLFIRLREIFIYKTPYREKVKVAFVESMKSLLRLIFHMLPRELRKKIRN